MKKVPVWIRFFVLSMSLAFANRSLAQEATPEPQPPVIAAASLEAEQAVKAFQIRGNLIGELVAAEPQLANPVAFTIDDSGRIFVCETFRQEQGVTDNRSHDDIWLDHDLAARSVADRIAYHQRLLADGGLGYTRQDDRIRLLIDLDRDGRTDESKVFADGFNQLESGTGASVLVVGTSLWYTCIPHVWELTDSDQNGLAEQRKSLYYGFGVHVAFRGHDLHGLTCGPDGRVYFSIGDRGYHVVTPDGKIISDPDSGAVFRCFPNGKNLEVVATGLRNPQELVFDQFGNLFTGDNNSDSGDRARWVHVLPGSDTGWRMHYQYLPDRGPFNRDKLWYPKHPGQPAYVLPPIANLGDGPSGVCYYPGTGFSPNYKDHFLMCDFRGTTAASGIRAFQLKPRGASFEIANQSEPIWQILATDAMFGPDGFLYVSDWVNGWVGEGKGRIYRFGDPKTVSSKETREVAEWLQSDVLNLDLADLKLALRHDDQRIRLKAQFELVRRKEFSVLLETSLHEQLTLARIHGLWGIQQLFLQFPEPAYKPLIVELIATLACDQDPEIRAQTFQLAGECRLVETQHVLEKGLEDNNSRCQMLAALGLKNLPVGRGLVEKLIQVLAQMDTTDPALFHSLVAALSSAEPELILESCRHHESTNVRLAAVVALRKGGKPQLAEFLLDEEALVVEEVARAIYDERNEQCLKSLADAMLKHPWQSEFTRRAIFAGLRVGRRDDFRNLCRLALDSRFSEPHRVMAWEAMGAWAEKRNRDWITGAWWPKPAFPIEEVSNVLQEYLPQIGDLADPEMKLGAIRCVETLKPVGSSKLARSIFEDPAQNDDVRIAALRAMVSMEPNPNEVLQAAIRSERPLLRTEGRYQLQKVQPELAWESALAATDSTHLTERQGAYSILGMAESATVYSRMTADVERLHSGNIADDTRLDVRMAAEKLSVRHAGLRKALSSYLENRGREGSLGQYMDALRGGNAERGRRLFHEKVQLSCLRCHRVGTEGGFVGPNLTDIGARKDREYLLRSIVDPNAEIAEKFGSVIVVDQNGNTWSGIVHLENQDLLRLVKADGDFVTIAQSDIVDRRDGKSAMPTDLLNHLTLFELRDLVEYMSKLEGELQPEVESLEIK